MLQLEDAIPWESRNLIAEEVRRLRDAHFHLGFTQPIIPPVPPPATASPRAPSISDTDDSFNEELDFNVTRRPWLTEIRFPTFSPAQLENEDRLIQNLRRRFYDTNLETTAQYPDAAAAPLNTDRSNASTPPRTEDMPSTSAQIDKTDPKTWPKLLIDEWPCFYCGNQNVNTMLDCGHGACLSCYERWMTQNRQCPYCRRVPRLIYVIPIDKTEAEALRENPIENNGFENHTRENENDEPLQLYDPESPTMDADVDTDDEEPSTNL